MNACYGFYIWCIFGQEINLTIIQWKKDDMRYIVLLLGCESRGSPPSNWLLSDILWQQWHNHIFPE